MSSCEMSCVRWVVVRWVVWDQYSSYYWQTGRGRGRGGRDGRRAGCKEENKNPTLMWGKRNVVLKGSNLKMSIVNVSKSPRICLTLFNHKRFYIIFWIALTFPKQNTSKHSVARPLPFFAQHKFYLQIEVLAATPQAIQWEKWRHFFHLVFYESFHGKRMMTQKWMRHWVIHQLDMTNVYWRWMKYPFLVHVINKSTSNVGGFDFETTNHLDMCFWGVEHHCTTGRYVGVRDHPRTWRNCWTNRFNTRSWLALHMIQAFQQWFLHCQKSGPHETQRCCGPGIRHQAMASSQGPTIEEVTMAEVQWRCYNCRLPTKDLYGFQRI